MLFRFWGQKVKGQGHSRRRHNRRRQPVEFHLVYVLLVLDSTNIFVFRKVVIDTYTSTYLKSEYLLHCVTEYLKKYLQQEVHL